MTSFEREFGNRKVGFLIRKFEERNDRTTLVNTVRDTFRQRGLTIIDASEKTLHPEAWGNVREFLDHCTFGVVIVDNLSPITTGFNPNVFLEIGYLLALKKNIFILIQNSLAATLPTDIKPFIYTSFDSQDIESTRLRNDITKWIDDTVNYNPGYLSIYLKGEIIGIDAISELKNVAFSISFCTVIENDKLIQPDKKELIDLGINTTSAVRKLSLKTQTKEMAEKFVSDYANGFYNNVPHFRNSVLKITLDTLTISEEYADGGIHYLFNNDKEALVYCQNEGIQHCKDEELYAYNHFKKKKTNKLTEIEIVILPKFNDKNCFLYISNFIHDERRHNVKMCHYPKDNSRIVLPLTTIDILFLVVYGYMPIPEKLSINSDYRKQYLQVVDLHLDKVKYTIEKRIPIELGLAGNVNYFDL